ncbi:DNA methyltransferase [Hugenholtzia roseola]|uniref:DNA methyltransferase n=1 Tax=Hugenholtzia roseola TaxID=1002 RepID=UPI0004012594|nr:DNA methyltransferase [Hugenholtzia roseola]
MFDQILIDKSWSFSEYSPKDTSYVTHSYYTYPAKFIPQLASRLILAHSQEGEMVIDPFMGSGTTILESLVHQRVGIGTDINEIAYLVAKTKTTPIKSSDLTQELFSLEMDLKNLTNGRKEYAWEKACQKLYFHERIDYWYKSSQKENLAILLYRILEIEDESIKNFFLVAFAQILKTCSIWLQKSIKPTRDLKKKDYDVLTTFLRQAKKMLKKNEALCQILSPQVAENVEHFRKIACQDARNLPCQNEMASLIVTSPPYVTSYEYADLHQLPLYWLGHLEELAQFRKKFIGSSAAQREEVELHSNLATAIVSKLGNNKKGREVRNYFADMYEVFKEMYRVLKPQGKACIVIGNTNFRGVEIQNAEVFVEQMQQIGFQIFDVVKREIPSKMLPSTRDSQTGQFAKATDANLKLAYPTEYILIMQKSNKYEY